MAGVRRLLPSLLASLALAGAVISCGIRTAPLPDALSDGDFWQLIADLSEPGGTFQSDNLVSNEGLGMVAEAAARARPGHVYVGVGPEQNFSYIAALQPPMAFIVDIRRENLQLHLMYKALFELSADRAEFVSRLFTRPRPEGLDGTATVTSLIDAYLSVPRPDESVFTANLAAMQQHLTGTRALPIAGADLEGIGRVYRAFYWYGLAISYGGSLDLRPVPERLGGTYSELMKSIDRTGIPPAFLGSEAKFAAVKARHARNLIVPVAGDFAGPRAMRGVGDWVRERAGAIGMFYVSNVETYLQRDGKWPLYCGNLLTMPFDAAAVLVRPSGPGALPGGVGIVPMAATIDGCR
jgi:hypothetical protein